MNKLLRILTASLLWLTLSSILCAQNYATAHRSARTKSLAAERETKKMQAIGRTYADKLDSLAARNRAEKYEGTDTLQNPFFASLFGSPMLYDATLHRAFSLYEKEEAESTVPYLPSSVQNEQIVALSDRQLLDTYAHTPWLVTHAEPEKGLLNVDERIRESKRGDAPRVEHLEESNPEVSPSYIPIITQEGDWDIRPVRKPNFWTFKANLAFQFTQNYVSDNWYNGGESHNTLLASTVLEANYNNQQRVAFDNKLEMKLGFQTSQTDEQHKYKTNSDLLRLTNKLGIKAVKDWYYTLMLQSWTQFCRGYKSNDAHVYSDFMSPFESLLSIGMDYQKTTKNNRFKVSATISPFAVKLKYVDRLSLATSYGINEGHHSDWTYGSNITLNYTWTIVKNISWAGRIYWFTDYSKTQIEWENTFNLTINKFLSAKLFLYPRFDDSVSRDEGESYLQFNELLSLGFNFNF